MTSTGLFMTASSSIEASEKYRRSFTARLHAAARLCARATPASPELHQSVVWRGWRPQ